MSVAKVLMAAGLAVLLPGLLPGQSNPPARAVQLGAPVAAPVHAPSQARPTFIRTRGEAPPPPSELSLAALLQEVLSRSPTLAQMQAVWQAASARYPQVTSLEDPMLTGIIGPASFASSEVEGAYRIEYAQKFPFPGKRRLRGENARYEAGAAASDLEDMRLQLIETVKSAYYDYFLAGRAVAVNQESLGLLDDFRKNALARYKQTLVTEQDVLQAEVELGRQHARQLELVQMRKIAEARLNTLLRRPPDQPLPPPPARVDLPMALPPAAALRERALAVRADIQALAQRLAAEEINLALTRKEYLPDFEVMAAYDAFWQPRERDLRPMVGVRFNLPVRLARRDAAVAEATAKLAQRHAELARKVDQVQLEVHEAYEQAVKGEQQVRLYRDSILPAAERNVKTAQSLYVTGKIAFLNLIEAQRSAVNLRERYYEILTDYHRRLATLERAVGGSLEVRSSEFGLRN